MILSSTKWNVKDEILCGIKPYNKATIDRLLTAHVSKDPSDFKIKMGPRKRHYFLAMVEILQTTNETLLFSGFIS